MRSIIGENGREYIIVDEIGRGGQGRVFSLQGGQYAFKLLSTKTSSRKAQLLKRKISYIKTRDIKDLPIARPKEQVRGDILGYIMDMAIDMMPLEDLLKPSDDNNWWFNTGGLRKRLNLLYKLAKVLSDLHSKGLVYGDLSPKNVFVSIDKDNAEIFLIDTDNITHSSKVGEAVYTPGYGAPEIIKQETGYDTYTDDFSFAVIAYQLLTLNHPFIGDYVNNGDPELEEEAYLCTIPWIEHNNDDINKSSTGLNSLTTISHQMMEEFTNTFENALDDKFKRTTTSKWCESIGSTINYLLQCEQCNNEFLHRKFKKPICPFCNQEMDFFGIVTMVSLNRTLKKEIENKHDVSLENISIVGNELMRKVCNPNKYVSIIENDIYLNKSSKELIAIKISKDKVYFRGMSQKSISIYLQKEEKLYNNIDISSEQRIDYKNDFFIYFEDINIEYQRVIKVRKYPR